MNRQIFAVSLIISSLIYSCRNLGDQNVAGGPCSYETVMLPAEVTEVYKTASGIDAELVIRDSNNYLNGPDSLLLSKEFGHDLSSREADSIGLKKGTRFKYVIKNIIDGHCTDHIESLELQPY
jgi:hypothetical protein